MTGKGRDASRRYRVLGQEQVEGRNDRQEQLGWSDFLKSNLEIRFPPLSALHVTLLSCHSKYISVAMYMFCVCERMSIVLTSICSGRIAS